MSTPTANAAFFVAGRLAANAASLATAYPHGGVALGLVGNVDIVLGALFRRIRKPENNASDGIIWLGGPTELVVSLKSWDPDGVAKLMRGGSAPGGVPNLEFLSSEIGASPTPLTNVVWSPVNPAYPFTVLHDVIAVPEGTPTRFSAYRFIEWRLRLLAQDINDSLGEIGDSGVTL